MQVILTKEEYDNLKSEAVKEAKDYVKKYSTYVYARCSAAIEHAIGPALSDNLRAQAVKAFMKEYDKTNPAPETPLCLK